MQKLGLRILCSLCVLCTSASAAMQPYPDSTKDRTAAHVEVSQLIDHDYGIPAKRYGSWKLLVVCVDFIDKPFQTPLELFDTLVFGNGFGTMNDFYMHNSYGRFSLVSLHIPSQLYVRAPQPYTYYVDNDYGLGAPPNISTLLSHVLGAIDSLVDFSEYINLGDEDILGVAVVHAGTGAEYTGLKSDIWSHVSKAYQTWDGAPIRRYMILPEFYETPGDMQVGVFAHEFGHILGLPDLYDIDRSSRGIGSWSLMAAGTWNGAPPGSSPASLDAWCKLQLGFMSHRIVDGSESIVLRPSQVCDTVIRVSAYDVAGYYLIENRQRVNYDAYSPGGGLLIWRIDEMRLGSEYWNRYEWYPGHEGTGNYLVALIQADGRYELERKVNDGDPLDAYPGTLGNTEFGPDTHPSSDWYNGAHTGVRIWHIARSGENMTFLINTGLPTNVLDSAITCEPRRFAGKIGVFNILGQKIAEVSGTYLNGQIQVSRPSRLRELCRSRGIYFLRMRLDHHVYTKKIRIIR